MMTTNLFDRLFRCAEFFLGLVGFLAIVLATTGVLTRFVFKVSITWNDELLRTVFVWAYFIGSALLYRRSGLMRLELIDDALLKRNNERWYKIVSTVQNGGIALFSGVLCYYIYKIVRQQFMLGQTTTTSSTPAWVSPGDFWSEWRCLLYSPFFK